MTVTEVLGGLGAWSVQLSDETPDEVLGKLGFFGHIAVVRGRVDVSASSSFLLNAARYVGVLRDRSKDRRTLEGDGMVFWLGDEDGKGKVLETPVTLNAASLTAAVNAVLPPAVHAGAINAKPGTYTGKHQFESPRAVLDRICDAFDVEYRVNGDATLDVGTQAQLYRSTPATIIAARNVGADMDLASLGAQFDVDETVRDYTTRVLLLGSKTEGEDEVTFATGSANAPTVPYLDRWGNPVQLTRTISESGTPVGSVIARAQLQLNRFNRTAVSLKVSATDYEVSGPFTVGDNAYVYDPANGIFDAARSIDFRGELIHPDVVRISGASWPITDDHTVAFRAQDGSWVDLTPWVVWESGGGEITVGDLPKSLTGGSSNPVIDRLDSLPDTTTPTAPTDLALGTFAVAEGRGQLSAIIRASWAPPLLNTDGSVVTDLAHYFVEWRMIAPGMVWQQTAATGTFVPAGSGGFGTAPFGTSPFGLGGGTSESIMFDIGGLVVDWDYEVRVAAVDRAGHVSAYTPVLAIHTAVDDIPAPAPSDPQVSNYLGQLRIRWDGLDNTGSPMPADFNRVEVHVSATSGFSPDLTEDSATRVASLSTDGYAYATAPYGETRYVKLVAFDTAGNPSSSSGQIAGSTGQVVSADIFNGAVGSAKLADLAVITAKIDDLAVNDAKIGNLSVGKLTAGVMNADVTISGRFATALTNARVELNALGVQKWNASNQLLVSLTGTQSLITGQIQTALSGERLIMNPGGANPSRMDFYPTSGSEFASVEAETVGGQAAVTISANNATMSGVSGVVAVRRSFAHIAYGRKDLTSVVSDFYCDNGTARVTSGIVDVMVRNDANSPGGNRFAMTMGSGNTSRVASTQLNYWSYIGGQPWLAAVNQDCGIWFGGGVAHIVGNDGFAHRDLQVDTLFYGSLSNASSQTIKSDIEDVAGVVDVRAAFKRARAKRYKVQSRAVLGRAANDDTGPVEARPAPTQVGLMAEQMPASVQTMVPAHRAGDPDVLGYDLNGVLALTWDGVAVALDGLDELRAEIAKLREDKP